jgi:hypothetical protein
MRHQLGEGEEVKNRQKEIAARQMLGSETDEPAIATDYYDIDPADFIDPEEFRCGRRGFNAPCP